ncbi:ECF RNA polymerase sigma factor SigE [Maioricimonas rarisocia]|uniref:RNA polymerase sigma factor SigZ n=1 Tax=Maioricimonas rarisocia TaxID=2528026 RepID=A0A517ZEE6_9PLAN|nr:RNA polymerase sigma factor SigZ [Maioricimonas rarisocia]QDU40840.1 ECF RNA polymerase sigma factor SigE [Maioricimonas rarisocia]
MTATEKIWSQLSDDLRRFIRRRVTAEDVADDLLQETFLRIHRNVGKLRETDRLAAWVYQIARNVIHDHYRRNTRDVSLKDMDVAEDRDGIEQLRAGASVWLEELIDQLSPTYQEAVRLSEIEGMPQHEVAGRLGLSVSGAKSRIQRGRIQLRDALDQCCAFQFDRQGNVIDCDPKPGRSVCNGCSDLELPPPS